MAKLAVLITSRLDEAHQVGDAWQAAGAPGVSFVETYGLRRLQETRKSSEILPGMLSLLDILRDNDETGLILISLLEDGALVDALLQATESILGSLQDPNNGVFFVIDVEKAIGIRRHGA